MSTLTVVIVIIAFMATLVAKSKLRRMSIRRNDRRVIAGMNKAQIMRHYTSLMKGGRVEPYPGLAGSFSAFVEVETPFTKIGLLCDYGQWSYYPSEYWGFARPDIASKAAIEVAKKAFDADQQVGEKRRVALRAIQS